MEMAEWATYMKSMGNSYCSSVFEVALRWKNDCRKRVAWNIFQSLSSRNS